MRHLIVNFCCLLAAVTALTGCVPQANTLGVASTITSQQATATIAATKQKPLAKLVSVRGTMIEKCPVAGCWFNLHDQTGTIKVDTKAAGFTVTDVPLQTAMTVTGKVVRNGTDKMIEAKSLSY